MCWGIWVGAGIGAGVAGIGATGLGCGAGELTGGGAAGAGEAGRVGKFAGGVTAPGLARAAARSWSIAVIRLALDIGWSGIGLEMICFDLILLPLSSCAKDKVILFISWTYNHRISRFNHKHLRRLQLLNQRR